jgi:ABC-type antimicrobial peptide transport system permease subunit
LSVRIALGASRFRLARQLLVESLVLAGVGAAGGVLFAAWGSRSLVAQLPTSGLPVVLDLPFDWRVLTFTSLVTIATAAVFGTAPAFRASRAAPIDALKEEGRTAAGPRRASVLVLT